MCVYVFIQVGFAQTAALGGFYAKSRCRTWKLTWKDLCSVKEEKETWENISIIKLCFFMKIWGLRHPKSSKIGVVRHPGAILGALGLPKASQVIFFLLFASLLGYHFGAFWVLFHIKILRVFLEGPFACICLKRYPPGTPEGPFWRSFWSHMGLQGHR